MKKSIILICAMLIIFSNGATCEEIDYKTERNKKLDIQRTIKNSLAEIMTELEYQYGALLTNEEQFSFFCLRYHMMANYDVNLAAWADFAKAILSCSSPEDIAALLYPGKDVFPGVTIPFGDRPTIEEVMPFVEEAIEVSGYSRYPHIAAFPEYMGSERYGSNSAIPSWSIYIGDAYYEQLYTHLTVISLSLNNKIWSINDTMYSEPRGLTILGNLEAEERQIIGDSTAAMVSEVISDVIFDEETIRQSPLKYCSPTADEPLSWVWIFFHTPEAVKLYDEFADSTHDNRGYLFWIGTQSGRIYYLFECSESYLSRMLTNIVI